MRGLCCLVAMIVLCCLFLTAAASTPVKNGEDAAPSRILVPGDPESGPHTKLLP
jgi:hypothetical protein